MVLLTGQNGKRVSLFGKAENRFSQKVYVFATGMKNQNSSFLRMQRSFLKPGAFAAAM